MTSSPSSVGNSVDAGPDLYSPNGSGPQEQPWRVVYAEVVSDREAFSFHAYGSITEETLTALEGFVARQRARMSRAALPQADAQAPASGVSHDH